MQETDREIITMIINGADGAFEELVHRYTTLIYNFAYRLTGNVDAAEDITQETFIKVWKNINKYNPSYNFKSWIFTIARNTATDYLRKKKSILFSSMDDEENPSFESTIVDDADIPSESLIKLEDSEYLNNILKKLPFNYQSVILLRYQNDMTFEEISEVMDKPLNTVKSWHRRGILKLRSILQ